MQQRSKKSEPNIAEAAENTGRLIRELQSRLTEGREVPRTVSQPIEMDASESPTADLEQQLQEYFTTWPGEEPLGPSPLTRMRDRVLDGVAARILQSWQQEGDANLFETEVTERLIQEVIQLLATKGGGTGPRALEMKSAKGPQLPS